MNEPTLTCPSCQTTIKLTESLAAPLLESTRKQFQEQLARKETEMASRELLVRNKEKELAEAKNKIDAQVNEQVQAQLRKDRETIATEEARKARLAIGNDLEQKKKELLDLQEILKSRDEKLAEAQRAEATFRKKQRELDDAKRELELTVEKRVQENLQLARLQAQRDAEEAFKFKVMEKEQTINSMQKQIEELRRKAEQGSQQLQGSACHKSLE